MTSMTSPFLPFPKLYPPGVFPDPVVVPPHRVHQQTFIILHGRGSTAHDFGPPLLNTPTASGHKLQTVFPHAKLIFLSASRSFVTIHHKSGHQWFDSGHLKEMTQRQDLMKVGLKKSCEYIHRILREEVALIGRENVVLWGFSQGCAMALTVLLALENELFAAVVGMSGWLPFASHIKKIAQGDGTSMGNSTRSVSGKVVLGVELVTFLKKELERDSAETLNYRQIPVFLGHGKDDEKVPLEFGKEVEECMKLLGIPVDMKEYPGVGHMYSPAMLEDIFSFLKAVFNR